VPIIMLTGQGECARVVEAVPIGVKSRALQERLVSVLARPRPPIKTGDYDGPAPRKTAMAASAVHAGNDEAIANLFVLN
jgi:two-component system, chemotaxis family, chemotaxis protein CheY